MTESGHINIVDIDLEKEMKNSYLDYSMSVIVSRALPDVRDGMKPVHRRIIFGMQEQGLFPDRSYSKSARLVGDVMAKFHPHGDAAIYDATVRLAQPFNMRYTLVDGQGNFGSVDGDGAAAPRYTELRMAKITTELLRDINKNTVNFKDNYDGREREPEVLPARFPNLLVNGSSGIAVGMATNMPPHNLRETIDGVVAYMDNPDISIEEISRIITAPDFPTGGDIMGYEGVKRAYRTGRGKVILRGVASIEEKNGRNRIVVTEIPYQVNKSNLIIKIAEYVKEKRLEGISDLRDESDRKGMRIVIELKRDANPNVVLNNLYKYTQMQTTFGVINLALVNGVPKVLNIKELIAHYVDHQEEVVTRRTQFDLEKAEARAHIVEGLLKAIDNIDEIIHIIRTSYSDALEKLMERFAFSELQAQAILDMRLKRLQGLEREKLQEEYDALLKEIKRFKEILADRNLLFEIIKTEILEIKEKYGDERRTNIIPNYNEIDSEELIEEEDVVITLTNQGYIKRASADLYKVQNRGGKGIQGITTKEDDFVESLVVASTHSVIYFFTNFGKIFSLKGYEIPVGGRQAKGQAIINLLQLESGERVNAVIPLLSDDEDSSLMMITKTGLIKKTELSMFTNIRKSGIRAINLLDDDELIGVKQIKKDNEVIIVSKHGNAIRIHEDNIRSMGRTAQGVRGIRLSDDDEVVSMDIVDNNEFLLIVSENGYGKKTGVSNYKVQNRGGRGVKTYNISEKTGNIVSAKLINPEDEVMVISLKGDIIRLSVANISTKGRNTMGVKIQDVKSEDDRIVAVAKYIEDVDESEE